jgi:hypothetical protein
VPPRREADSTRCFASESRLAAPRVLKHWRMRRAFARLLLVLAALLLLPGGAWARAQYLCHMSGRVQSSCCCKASAKAVAPSERASVRAADCCERLTPAVGAVATSARVADSVAPPALAARVPLPLVLAPRAQAPASSARQSRGPPGPTRALFAVHCAYLC